MSILGNSNLVYTIIRKRQVFHALANLPSDVHGISKCLNSRKGLVGGSIRTSSTVSKIRPEPEVPAIISGSASMPVLNSERGTPTPEEEEFSDIEGKVEASMEGSRPALPAEPGTLKVSLLDTPAIGQMTERESAHPTTPLADFGSIEEEEDERGVTDAINSEFDEAHASREVEKSRSNIQVAPANLPVITTTSPIWNPTPEWVASWRVKLPLQTIMRLLQVLVPQVEKICIDK